MSFFFPFLEIPKKNKKLKNQENNLKKEKDNYNEFYSNIIEAGNYINILNIEKTINSLDLALSYLKKGINEIKNIEDFYIMDDELIKSLNKFNDYTKDLKDKDLSSKILNLLNKIIINIYNDPTNYKYICEYSLIFQNLSVILSLIYLNTNTTIVFLLLNKLLDNFIEYLINESLLNEYERNTISEFKKSFPNYHSDEFNNIYNNNFINDLKKIGETNKIKEIDELIDYFNNLKLFTEQYELINIINKNVLSDMLDEINMNNSRLYIVLGKFFMQFLFNNKYILNTNIESENDRIPAHNYITIKNGENCYDLTEFENFKDKKYIIDVKYEIIKSYEKEICDMIINNYIENIIDIDINYDIQYLIYLLSKNIYFIYPNQRKNLIGIIPKVLKNIDYFKEEGIYKHSLEVREFGFYLKLNDFKIGPLIKSKTEPYKDILNYIYDRINIIDISLRLGFFNKIIIKSDNTYDITFKMDKINSILYFEFYIEDDLGIDVRIYKNKKNENDYELFSCVNNIKSINENETKCQNIRIILANESNDSPYYKITFSNKFLIPIDKIIHYTFTILEPEE